MCSYPAAMGGGSNKALPPYCLLSLSFLSVSYHQCWQSSKDFHSMGSFSSLFHLVMGVCSRGPCVTTGTSEEHLCAIGIASAEDDCRVIYLVPQVEIQWFEGFWSIAEVSGGSLAWLNMEWIPKVSSCNNSLPSTNPLQDILLGRLTFIPFCVRSIQNPPHRNAVCKNASHIFVNYGVIDLQINICILLMQYLAYCYCLQL